MATNWRDTGPMSGRVRSELNAAEVVLLVILTAFDVRDVDLQRMCGGGGGGECGCGCGCGCVGCGC
jgi:hypothetical protein